MCGWDFLGCGPWGPMGFVSVAEAWPIGEFDTEWGVWAYTKQETACQPIRFRTSSVSETCRVLIGWVWTLPVWRK